MLNGMTYMVRPFMQPLNTPFRVARRALDEVIDFKTILSGQYDGALYVIRTITAHIVCNRQ